MYKYIRENIRNIADHNHYTLWTGAKKASRILSLIVWKYFFQQRLIAIKFDRKKVSKCII